MNPGISNQSSNDSLAQEFANPTNDGSKVLRFKFGRFLTKRNLVVAGIIALVLILVTVYFTQFSYKAEDLRVSNVSDRSATISWVTSDKSEGYVLVSKDGFTLPFHIGEMGATKNYDDRDVTVAELENADKLSEQAKNSQENGNVSLPDIDELEITQVGEYYVHHVTVTNLEPDSEYEFMVGNGSIFVKTEDLDRESTKFSTAPELSEVIVPDPAYGTVKELSFAKDAITDGVVYLQIKDDAQGKTSTLISAPLSDNGSWYLDLANAKNSDSIETPFLKNAESLAESTYHAILVQAGPKGTEEAIISLGNDAPTETIFIEPTTNSDSSDSKSSLINRVFAATWTVTCPNGASFSESNATVQSTFNSVAGGDGESRWKTEACVGQQSSGSSGNTNPSGATGTGGNWEVSCNGKSYCENSLSVQGGFNSIAAQSGQTGISLWGQQACASGAASTVCTTQPPQEPPTSGGGSGGSSGGLICGEVNKKSEGAECDLGATCQLLEKSDSWPNAGGCDGDGPGDDLSCLDDPRDGKSGICVSPGKTVEELIGGGGGGGTESEFCNTYGSCNVGEVCNTASGCTCGVGSVNYHAECTEEISAGGSGGSTSCADSPLGTTSVGSTSCTKPGCAWYACASGCLPEGTSNEVACPTRRAGGSCTENGEEVGDLYCHDYIWRDRAAYGSTCDNASGCWCLYPDGRGFFLPEIGQLCGPATSTESCGSDLVCEIGQQCVATAATCKCGNGAVGSPFVCTEAIYEQSATPTDSRCTASDVTNEAPCIINGQSGQCGTKYNASNGTNEFACIVPQDLGVLISYKSCTKADVWSHGRACVNTWGNLGICSGETGNCESAHNGELSGYSEIGNGDQCGSPFGCYCRKLTVIELVPDGGYCPYNTCAFASVGAACESKAGDKSCRIVSVGSNQSLQCVTQPVSLVEPSNDTELYSSRVLGASVGNGYYYDPEKGIVFTESGKYCTTYENSKICFMAYAEGENSLYLDQNNDGILNEGDIDLTSQVEEIGLVRESTVFSIEITSGFNLISFPGYFGDSAGTAKEFLQYVNDEHGDSVYSIAKFESGRWVVVGNRDGESYGDQDFQLLPGEGYLIRAKSSFQLNITGFDFTDPVPTVLKPGWNLMAVHGTQTQYTAESLLDSFNANDGFVSDNVTRWDTSRGRYDGLQKEKDESDVYQVYGFDFPISKVQSYFVRVEEGEITWTPE